MALKMRIRKDDDGICQCCGATAKRCLDMFDIRFGNETITICDECNNKLLLKTLKAQVHVNGRLKTKDDIAIINARHAKIYTSESRGL